MPYTSFTLNEIKKIFGVTNKVSKLFFNINKQEPSLTLLDSIENSHLFSLSSEKEKSEAIIFPIMIELKKKNKNKISIFSGRRLDVDSEKGLSGECDFIISNKPDLFEVDSPIIALIEAKKDDFTQGVAQCVAQMIGSRLFNEQRDITTPVIYGCVTNAREWQFLKLEDNLVTIDSDIYYLNQISELLGIFQTILEHY
ncbi:MAG: hypothetical protein AABZ74_16420 [Cyanobacteriota bacterium]